MRPDQLREDCNACAGLCCIALAFDEGPDFAADKEAGVRCQHLDGADRCTIHDQLEQKGYRGCVLFTCYGAGQRVTRDLLGPGGLAGTPDEVRRGIDLFRKARRLHEWLLLLHQSRALPLTATQAGECSTLLALLQASEHLDETWLTEITGRTMAARVSAYLQDLRSIVARGATAGSQLS